MIKYLFVYFILFTLSQAGIIGSAVGYGKDKVVDKAKETAIKVYKERKEIRRDNENKTGNKSLISKTEDKVDATKNTIKETAKNSIGKENLEFLKRAKGYTKDALIGKPLK